jgi:small subunit ribosomal protein S17
LVIKKQKMESAVSSPLGQIVMPKKIETGTVTSAAASKTRRVEIPRIIRHPKYGRILHSRTVCHVHDEAEESAPGDLVEIVECPPRSRTKRWELVRVVTKSTAVDLAALRSGARATEVNEASVRDEEAKATGQASEATDGSADDKEGVDA